MRVENLAGWEKKMNVPSLRLRSCKWVAGMEKNKRQQNERQRFLRKGATRWGSSSRWDSWKQWRGWARAGGWLRGPVLSTGKRCRELGHGRDGMEPFGDNTEETNQKRPTRFGVREKHAIRVRAYHGTFLLWAVSSSLLVSLCQVKWP